MAIVSIFRCKPYKACVAYVIWNKRFFSQFWALNSSKMDQNIIGRSLKDRKVPNWLQKTVSRLILCHKLVCRSNKHRVIGNCYVQETRRFYNCGLKFAHCLLKRIYEQILKRYTYITGQLVKAHLYQHATWGADFFETEHLQTENVRLRFCYNVLYRCPDTLKNTLWAKTKAVLLLSSFCFSLKKWKEVLYLNVTIDHDEFQNA